MFTIYSKAMDNLTFGFWVDFLIGTAVLLNLPSDTYPANLGNSLIIQFLPPKNNGTGRHIDTSKGLIHLY